MDRLSSYAARESEERTPEDRLKAEEESTRKLFEQLEIAKEAKAKAAAEAPPAEGESAEAEAESAPNGAPAEVSKETTAEPNGVDTKKGIPDSIKLFEIFHEQVRNLVSMQRLPIQDITALLVSLGNLAL